VPWGGLLFDDSNAFHESSVEVTQPRITPGFRVAAE